MRIVLVKSDRDASNCWESLLIDQYQCGPLVKDEMEKKLTLERFQKEVGAPLKVEECICLSDFIVIEKLTRIMHFLVSVFM